MSNSIRTFTFAIVQYVNLRLIVGAKRTTASYKYCPYLCRASLGSSASLKSRSNPLVSNDLKKMECDDLIAKSSSRTRTRRSVGLSSENAAHRIANNGTETRNKQRDLLIMALDLEMLRVLAMEFREIRLCMNSVFAVQAPEENILLDDKNDL